MIIGLGYKKRSGKDSVARILHNYYGFRVLHFADALKDGIGKGVFGFSDEQLNGSLKEEIDPFWSQVIALYEVTINGEVFIVNERQYLEISKITPICEKKLDITPRLLLQYAGTELFREGLISDIWVYTALRKFNANEDIVIADVRFSNEADAILAFKPDAYVVNVKRPGMLYTTDLHLSEGAMDGYPKWDYVINNDGTLKDLHNKVEVMMKNFGR